MCFEIWNDGRFSTVFLDSCSPGGPSSGEAKCHQSESKILRRLSFSTVGVAFWWKQTHFSLYKVSHRGGELGRWIDGFDGGHDMQSSDDSVGGVHNRIVTMYKIV